MLSDISSKRQEHKTFYALSLSLSPNKCLSKHEHFLSAIRCGQHNHHLWVLNELDLTWQGSIYIGIYTLFTSTYHFVVFQIWPKSQSANCHLTKMNINNLPNELLVKIFKNIDSLSQIFHLQIVCRRWKVIAELTLVGQRSLRCCFRGLDLSPYGSLTFLKDCFNEKNTLWFNCNTLTRSTIEYLIEKMPHIESLDLYKLLFYNEDSMIILTGWQENLSQLTMYSHINPTMFLTYEKQLTLMVEKYKLRHLYLLCIEMSPQLRLKLRSLQTFYHFNQLTAFSRIYNYPWLSAVESVGDQIESMHFITPQLISEKLDRALPNLKRLSLNVSELKNVKYVCDHFPSLTHLDLILYDTECNFMKILPSLVSLSLLQNLRIATPVRYFASNIDANQMPTVFPFYKVTTRNFQRRLLQLPKVTNLHLSIELKLIRIQFIDHIFPNVVSITFNGPIFRCECHFPVIGLCRRCSVAILRRLLAMRSLQRVYHNADLLFDCSLPETIPDTVLDPLFYSDEKLPLFDYFSSILELHQIIWIKSVLRISKNLYFSM